MSISKMIVEVLLKKGNRELLKLDGHHLRIEAGLLTGHCALREPLQKIRINFENTQRLMCYRIIDMFYLA